MVSLVSRLKVIHDVKSVSQLYIVTFLGTCYSTLEIVMLL